MVFWLYALAEREFLFVFVFIFISIDQAD